MLSAISWNCRSTEYLSLLEGFRRVKRPRVDSRPRVERTLLSAAFAFAFAFASDSVKLCHSDARAKRDRRNLLVGLSRKTTGAPCLAAFARHGIPRRRSHVPHHPCHSDARAKRNRSNLLVSLSRKTTGASCLAAFTRHGIPQRRSHVPHHPCHSDTRAKRDRRNLLFAEKFPCPPGASCLAAFTRHGIPQRRTGPPASGTDQPPASLSLLNKNMRRTLSADGAKRRISKLREIHSRKQILPFAQQHRRQRQVHFIDHSCRQVLANH